MGGCCGRKVNFYAIKGWHDINITTVTNAFNGTMHCTQDITVLIVP